MAFLKLRSPADMLVAIPYLLGFQPTDSFVVVGVRSGQLRFHVRGDLPAPDVSDEALSTAGAEVAALFRSRGMQSVVLVGYGPPDVCGRTLDAMDLPMRAAGIQVLDLLWVSGERYRSLLCERVDCCPAEGHLIDPERSPVAVKAVVAGLAVMPDRESVIRSYDPPTGPALLAIRAATARARAELAPLMSGPVEAREVEGLGATMEALDRYGREGGRLTDEEVARLTVVLADTSVRDLVWDLVDADLTMLEGLLVGAEAVDDPAEGDPAVGDPAVGDPAVGDPAVGDPAVGGPAVGGPAVGGPAVGGPAVGDRTPSWRRPFDPDRLAGRGLTQDTDFRPGVLRGLAQPDDDAVTAVPRGPWQAATPDAQSRLWTDVLRRCDPALAPSPGVLLAFTMWRLGDSVRAGAAVDRVLAADPRSVAGGLLAEALRLGLPPTSLDRMPADPDPWPDPSASTALADKDPAAPTHTDPAAPAAFADRATTGAEPARADRAAADMDPPATGSAAAGPGATGSDSTGSAATGVDPGRPVPRPRPEPPRFSAPDPAARVRRAGRRRRR